MQRIWSERNGKPGGQEIGGRAYAAGAWSQRTPRLRASRTAAIDRTVSSETEARGYLAPAHCGVSSRASALRVSPFDSIAETGRSVSVARPGASDHEAVAVASAAPEAQTVRALEANANRDYTPESTLGHGLCE